ncbi:hypothetical protein ACFXHA_45395 [Nocardia sp. NPDC059240]|uniref:hypothetical protein n=1 Tax=Nocardia sp. NPDC059240 TaxID=3346786 RepID=UPI0036A85D20
MVHLHLEFGQLIADFQGGQEQVAEVAAELSTTGLAVTVTVDDRVAQDMPHLPCSWLWDQPDRRRTGSGPLSEIDRASMSQTVRTGPDQGRSVRRSEVAP